MNEIYWITRLDTINIFITIVSVLGLLITIFIIVAYICYGHDKDNDALKIVNKFMKIVFPVTFISILGSIFIPTTKEAILIYGVDEAVDYINSNDKLSDALDKFIIEYTKK